MKQLKTLTKPIRELRIELYLELLNWIKKFPPKTKNNYFKSEILLYSYQDQEVRIVVERTLKKVRKEPGAEIIRITVQWKDGYEYTHLTRKELSDWILKLKYYE